MLWLKTVTFSKMELLHIAPGKSGDYLNQVFPDRWIGRRGPLEWAARSPDLTPCDFFHWGFLKSKVYSTRPQNLEELEQKLEQRVD